jgi:hypothetical protein
MAGSTSGPDRILPPAETTWADASASASDIPGKRRKESWTGRTRTDWLPTKKPTARAKAVQIRQSPSYSR